MWFASPGNQGWGNKITGRNNSVLDVDITSSAPSVLKPSAGRIIRIINNLDHSIQVKTDLHQYFKNYSFIFFIFLHMFYVSFFLVSVYYMYIFYQILMSLCSILFLTYSFFSVVI